MNILNNQDSILPLAIDDSVAGGNVDADKERLLKIATLFGISNKKFSDLMEIAKWTQSFKKKSCEIVKQ